MLATAVTRAVGCGLVGLTGLIGVGCAGNVSQADYEAVIDENNELRGQIAGLEGERAMWSDTKSKLEAENAELAGKLEEMRASGQMSPTGQIGEATVYTRGSDVVVEVAGDVLFDSGKVELKSSAKRTLDEVASVLNRQFAANSIRIEGHSDSDPIRKSGWKTNEHLSFERALAVENYLASRGVQTTRMYSAGFGPDKPRGSKPQSRRVEIIVLGG